MTDERDLPPVPNDRSDDAPLPRGRWRNRVSGAVDEAPRPIERVRHLHIGVAEACGQRRAKRSRCRRLAEIGGEPCNGRAGPPTTYAPQPRAPASAVTAAARARKRAANGSLTGSSARSRRSAPAERARETATPTPATAGSTTCRTPPPPVARRETASAPTATAPASTPEQVSRLKPPHHLLLRSHQKDVVGAVAPAVPIEKRVPDESLADADDGGHDVEGRDDGAGRAGARDGPPAPPTPDEGAAAPGTVR